MTLLDSTLFEINTSQNVTISKNEVRYWKLKLLRIIPGLREQWVKVRAHTHQTALFSTVIHVMNKELDLKDCSKEEIFLIKQACLRIARKFIPSKKARHIKKPEVWARAICFKAVYETFPDAPFFLSPYLSSNTQKVLENKKWQLNQVVDNKKTPSVSGTIRDIMSERKEKAKRLHEKALWVDKEIHRLVLIHKAVNDYKTISEAIKSLIDFYDKHKEEKE